MKPSICVQIICIIWQTTNWLIGLFIWQVNTSWVILCLKFTETRSLLIHIYIFCIVVFEELFLHTVILYQVFLSNTNNLHTVVWFQVFLSNTNNLHIVIWFLLFLSKANNLLTFVWFQIFLSNTNNLQTNIFEP